LEVPDVEKWDAKVQQTSQVNLSAHLAVLPYQLKSVEEMVAPSNPLLEVTNEHDDKREKLSVGQPNMNDLRSKSDMYRH
jgi:hypothetical protein